MHQVLIMAGGNGERLGNLTKNTPKSLIEVNGKPVICHQIDLLKRQGLTDIVISVGHRREQMVEYLGTGRDLDVSIEYLLSSDSYLRSLIYAARTALSGNYYLINGDLLFDADLEDMAKTHESEKGLITMGVAEVDDVSDSGKVMVSDGLVMELREKSDKGAGKVNAGIYLVSKEADLQRYSSWLELLNAMIEDRKIAAYDRIPRWIDIGTPGDLERAEKMWKT